MLSSLSNPGDIKKKKLFLFFLFLVALGLHCCWRAFSSWAGATLGWGAQACHCGGFSCCDAQALGTLASVVAAHGLWSEGSSFSCTWAYFLHGMWNLPGPGIKPVFPPLAAGFLSTVPPGKSSKDIFCACLFKLSIASSPVCVCVYVNRCKCWG